MYYYTFKHPAAAAYQSTMLMIANQSAIDELYQSTDGLRYENQMIRYENQKTWREFKLQTFNRHTCLRYMTWPDIHRHRLQYPGRTRHR